MELIVYQSSYISGWGPAHTLLRKAKEKIQLMDINQNKTFKYLCEVDNESVKTKKLNLSTNNKCKSMNVENK